MYDINNFMHDKNDDMLCKKINYTGFYKVLGFQDTSKIHRDCDNILYI